MADLIDRAAASAEMVKHAKGTTVIGGQTFRTIKLEDAIDAIAALPAPGARVKPLWQPIETAPRGGEWFIARTERGTTRVVHFADEYDRFPISHDGVTWPTAPTEWTSLAPVLAALEPAEAGGVPAWLSNCVVCGRIVDTREKDEGGDGHGCEYKEGWTCSSECAEKLHPDPGWMKDALAAEAGGVEARRPVEDLGDGRWVDVEPAEAGRLEAKPVAWRQEDHCHPGWYIYGDMAVHPMPASAQPLYATPAPEARKCPYGEIGDGCCGGFCNMAGADDPADPRDAQPRKEVMPDEAHEGRSATSPGVTAGAVEALVKAAEPFAFEIDAPAMKDDRLINLGVTIGDHRRLRAALAAIREGRT